MQNEIGKLYIVATPIGNLADFTLRAIETLKKVDLIICEDSRITKKLLNHYGISKELLVYNDHSDEKDRNKILENIFASKNLALVSDAGTPLISDPGYKLLKALKNKGVEVQTIPGPCSIIAALTIAGMPIDKFTFIGFLPNKLVAKEKILQDFSLIKTTLVCFETAGRLLETLSLIDKLFPKREVSVVREITKLYEEVRNGSASELMNYYQNNPDKLKGEIVLLLEEAVEDKENLTQQAIEELTKLIRNMTVKDAVEIISTQYPLPKKQIYKMALQLKN